ncbi:phasin family protein [Crenobacter sp. SG2305]|uniref:phasin family protein n=1 Tax=Crenobacter oryzisoli TaxID=3056844 RepID=UPI0025AB46E3|nr:phasin family protein [Crenobacter sp. SG2305]MDN0085409.1 phasin family protein [Crenobacter sp. SG2305]
MTATNESLSKLSLSGIESALRFAQISLEGTERLVRLNIELSKQLLEENVAHARELVGIKDPQQALNHLNKVAGQSVEQAVSNSRQAYDIVSQTHSEFTKLAETHLDELNKLLHSNLDNFAKQAPAGSEVVVSGLKSALASATAAASSVSKTAQQVSELTEANLRAAGNATSEAVKSTRRTNGAA